MEQFNDDRYFQYPPFNRHHTWRRDYDYEVPVVSSVGSGPKGDPMRYEDLTDEQLAEITGPAGASVREAAVSDDGELTLILDDDTIVNVDGNVKGPKGDKGDKGDTQTLEDLTDEQLEAIAAQAIAAGAKGDKGDTGDFNQLTQDEQDQIADHVGSQVADLALTDEFFEGETPSTTDEENPVAVIMTNLQAAGLHGMQLFISGLCIPPSQWTTGSDTDGHLTITLLVPIVHPNTTYWIHAIRATWVPQP